MNLLFLERAGEGKGEGVKKRGGERERQTGRQTDLQ